MKNFQPEYALLKNGYPKNQNYSAGIQSSYAKNTSFYLFHLKQSWIIIVYLIVIDHHPYFVAHLYFFKSFFFKKISL